MRYSKRDDDDDDGSGRDRKAAARWALVGAVFSLVMVGLSELEGSPAPIGALLTLLIIFSVFDL